MSSIAWTIPSTGVPVYIAAKAAIVGLTRTLAHELGPDGIRVNCIMPGAIVTERQKKLWLTDAYIAEVLSRQALKRLLIPEEVARLALFLAADDSSANHQPKLRHRRGLDLDSNSRLTSHRQFRRRKTPPPRVSNSNTSRNPQRRILRQNLDDVYKALRRPHQLIRNKQRCQPAHNPYQNPNRNRRLPAPHPEQINRGKHRKRHQNSSRQLDQPKQ